MPSLTKGEILYGVHPVSIALQEQKRDVYCLYIKQEPLTPGVREIIDACNNRGINHEVKPLNILGNLSSNRPHQVWVKTTSHVFISATTGHLSDKRPYKIYTGNILKLQT